MQPNNKETALPSKPDSSEKPKGTYVRMWLAVYSGALFAMEPKTDFQIL
jgi:hypothetical protein